MEIAITHAPGVLPSADGEAFLARHGLMLAQFAQVASSLPGALLVSGPTAQVVAHLGLPPPPTRIDILTAVIHHQAAAARLPACASVLTRRMAELQPGQVVIVLLLPEGSGVVVASFALEDTRQGVSAPGGAA